MLERAVTKKYRKQFVQKVQAVDLIYKTMVFYETKAETIIESLIARIRDDDRARGDLLMKMALELRKCKELVIDCATKLAPYQTPKLESLEVKSKVEHRFVVRAPQSIKSVEEWKKLTGAEELKIDQVKQQLVKEHKIVPSIHDYDTPEDEDDSDARQFYSKGHRIN